jgi:hypothetical protein
MPLYMVCYKEYIYSKQQPRPKVPPRKQVFGDVVLQGMDFMRVYTRGKQILSGLKHPEVPSRKRVLEGGPACELKLIIA